jgi:hypothetical protein
MARNLPSRLLQIVGSSLATARKYFQLFLSAPVDVGAYGKKQ